jgi:ABC-type transport system substrate-binding protein/tRNA A-37 threonylcarbamoyl transferase component Bud32
MPDVLTTGSVVAGYRIARLIGRGATGAVYLAEDGEGQQVALKVLIPELARNERFRERFLREARIAASLDEPHVVPTLATGEQDGVLYLAMRFVDGLDLREILKREGGLSAERAVDLVGQIAGALDSAHARGLVHRDVKPGNVLVQEVDAGEHAYLCDFGLARHLTSVDSLTGERAFVGTIAYISPEQIQGAAIDARADVYSLGCMLFECLTGEAPFARESEVAAVYAHMHEPPPRASDVRPGIPEAFDSVIAKALAKAPDDRFESCGELARASEAALRGELPHRRRARRRLALGGLVAAIAAAAAATAGIVLTDDSRNAAPPRLAIAPKTIGLIDATTHKVVGRISFASQPWDVAFDARQAWVLLGDERRVARVDLSSRKVLSSTRLPFKPGGIATGAGGAWVSEDDGPGLVRLDRENGRISKRFSVPIRGDRDASSPGIAVGAGSVWVARGPETVRVDPASGGVTKRLLTPLAANSIVFAEGAVWAASAENGRVMKIDPATNRITPTSLHATITDLAVGNGSVWVSIVPDNVVYRLSPDDGSVLATIPAGSWPSSLSVGNGLWIANAKGSQIVRVDASGARETLPLSGPAFVTRYHAGLLWTSVGAPEPVAATPPGRTLRIPLEFDAIGTADPAISGGPVFHQLAYATCPYLLNYPDASGAAGRVLRPEVAAAPPDISADGRTYTFRIRPGFRFSPPSGQAVTAETFRTTIERALSPKLATGGHPNGVAQILPDVAGAAAYASGQAPHISGITARGDTLTIRLTRAAGDLPARLRTSFFCPVPIGTPAVKGGGKTTPIPMAGPYYVASTSGGQVVLERNPNYSGDRPRRIEHIVYTQGVKAADAISRVEQGSADYVNAWTVTFDTAGPLAPGGSLDQSYGLASRVGRSGSARYLPSPAPGIDAIAFNTQRPLFRDVRMRRAAAYALDRRALAAVYGERPSDRLVPPAIAGPGGNIAYPDEPDLAAARRLAGPGADRKATLYFCGDPTNRRIAEIIRANLAEIGIDVRFNGSLKCLTGPDPKRMAAADIQLVSYPDEVLDPAPFVEFSFGNRFGASGYWRNARLRDQLDSARGTRGAARVAAYAALEKSLVRDAVPMAVYASWTTPEFFSARVGCKVSQGALNLADLGALCLRG